MKNKREDVANGESNVYITQWQTAVLETANEKKKRKTPFFILTQCLKIPSRFEAMNEAENSYVITLCCFSLCNSDGYIAHICHIHDQYHDNAPGAISS